MIAAVVQTGGTTVAVSEPEIAGATTELGRAGFYVEPSSAVAYAAAVELRSSGVIAAADTALVVLTGSGLKT